MATDQVVHENTRHFFAIRFERPDAQQRLQPRECVCPGKFLAETKHAGDDGNVSWHFSATLVEQGQANSQPIVCYQRGVYNRSNETILNVRWDVAGFRRRFLPKKYSNNSCSTLPGEMSGSPVSGPLDYGISLLTPPRPPLNPPREGWTTQKAVVTQPTNLMPIRSVFEVGINGEGLESTIIVYSYVQNKDEKSFTLTYELENRGRSPVAFQINLPVVSSMDKLPFLEPMFLEADSRIWFVADVVVPVAVQSALVLVSDPKTAKLGLATDVVGVYAPIDGKRRYSDETLLNTDSLAEVPILEVLKQLQALLSAGLPLLAAKFSFTFLPFLNPQIPDEQWPITSVLALVSSGTIFNLSRRFQKPKAARWFACFGLALGVISYLSLLALVDGLVFAGKPELQDFSVRSMFVLLFVGIGLAGGYASARIL